jgi:hypothetical protein
MPGTYDGQAKRFPAQSHVLGHAVELVGELAFLYASELWARCRASMFGAAFQFSASRCL